MLPVQIANSYIYLLDKCSFQLDRAEIKCYLARASDIELQRPLPVLINEKTTHRQMLFCRP